MWFDMAIVFGFPFLVAIAAIAYAAFRSYLKHKERMAMIEKGLVPPDFKDDDDADDGRVSKTSPITVTLVGVALTLGLLTLGVGPWLLGGLIPTAIGCAMLITQMRGDGGQKNGGHKDGQGEEKK